MPWRSLNAMNHKFVQNHPRTRKMPKMKTKSGAKKRFRFTATGRVKAGVAGKRHRLLNHTAKYIRSNRGTKVLKKGDEGLVKWYMPYNR
jgi:large subunit ribosomal protein L35